MKTLRVWLIRLLFGWWIIPVVLIAFIPLAVFEWLFFGDCTASRANVAALIRLFWFGDHLL